MKRITVLLGAGILLLCSMVWAAVPQLINFQGILRDGSGNPVTNGSYSVVFKIYDAPTGGNVLWAEGQSVTTTSGLFTTLLGTINPVPDSAFNDSSRYLGIKVGADPEMTPRQKLVSVGYSYVSSQWTSAAQDLFRLNGNVGIGTSSLFAKLDVNNSGSDPFAVTAIRGVAANSSTGIAWGGVFSATSSGGGTSQGIYATGGNIGVNGYSPGGDGVYGQGGTHGGDFLGTGGGSYGIRASGGAYGGYFTGTGFASYGVYATGESRGIDAVATSSSSNSTIGCSGGATNSFFGDAYGGFFTGSSTSGTSYGVYGRALSGYGVYGLGGTSGVRGEGSTYGVLGYCTGTAAVYGNIGGNFGTWGGYFQGDVKVERNLVVDGFIFKNGGGFKIDHPTDPANKYLYHSFVESPDMKNIYDGVVTINAQGEAIVTLPDWFGAENKDFRYQLTAIGAPGPNLYIAEEISKNQFRIAGGTAGMKVSWQVTGIRKDPYAEAHRIPVEEAKTGTERGKYLHPEEYGVSATLGMHYEEEQKLAAEHKKMEEQQVKMEAEHKRQEEERAKMEQERLIQEQKLKENNQR